MLKYIFLDEKGEGTFFCPSLKMGEKHAFLKPSDQGICKGMHDKKKKSGTDEKASNLQIQVQYFMKMF